MNELIDIAFKKAEALAQAMDAEDDIDLLPKTVATFIRVYSAQGLIDNGGYCYFFESDWPKQPPYIEFVDAYAEIGCKKQANELERIVSSFPFPGPHLKPKERKRYMDENYDEEAFEVKGWGDELCGDEEVWKKLTEYYKNNIDDFS